MGNFEKTATSLTIFITGSTSGIGEACAHKFASKGAQLILNGRDSSKLDFLKQTITEKYGVNAIVLPFDVRDKEAAQKSVSGLPDQWQAIDVLINNAGLVLGVDKEFEGDLEEWNTVIDTNIKGLLTITRLVVPGMVKRKKGHIINIGSIAGDAAYAGGSVYCATKSAVKALSDGLRIDLVDTPLRVTNIKPGMVETHFSITRFRGDKSKADAVYAGIKPLTGEDIAETVYFASSAPEHVQIAEVLIMPVNQATATVVYRSGEEYK
ncbi:MAG: SDR family NAD(P)-dependent oxidoreductase [Dysgonamonadaceae bacterium]|jgi:NADP-dependent 3-hydroxy acid dehydrogenase YdfG|nr:SDR family NAD(P)-dependent oxidoreductase [Dysgonamonadaceae bacterium]